MHYCINCGTRLTLREMEDRPVEACDGCGFVLWRDPKVVTMTFVLDGRDRLVLCQRATDPGYGQWCLPGGFVNDDEHPLHAAARECREEISARVDIDRLSGVYHIAKQGATSMVAIAYSGRLAVGAEPAPGPEMLATRSFALTELPQLAFSSHREALADWLPPPRPSGARI